MPQASCLIPPFSRAISSIAARCFSQCAAGSKMFATPWPLPAASISPKLFDNNARSLLRSCLAAFDVAKPITAASTPPASWYLEPSFAQAELIGVFSKTWQLACRKDQVSKPGAYATSFIGAEPVVVVHGDDGKIRAFSNVCRHHAARVCEGEGQTDSLVCPYHQWTYNLQGRLTKSTRMKGIQDFSASKVRLPELPLEVWGPFVFVLADAASGGSVPSVKAQLQAIQDSFENNSGWEGGEVTWRSLKHLHRRVYSIKCNWKVYIDNYLDGGYHIPHLHKGLASELDLASYQTTVQTTTSIQTCASTAARTGSAASYGFMFPNLAINKYGDWLDTNLVYPITADSCVVVFDWYKKSSADTASSISEADFQSSVAVQDEDVGISESVQSGLCSSTYDVGRYAPAVEQAAHAFHLLLHTHLNSVA